MRTRFYSVSYDAIGMELGGGGGKTDLKTMEKTCRSNGQSLGTWEAPDDGSLDRLLNEGASPISVTEQKGYGCLRQDMLSDAIKMLRRLPGASPKTLLKILESAEEDVFWFRSLDATRDSE